MAQSYHYRPSNWHSLKLIKNKIRRITKIKHIALFYCFVLLNVLSSIKSLKSKYQKVFSKTLNETEFCFVQSSCKNHLIFRLQTLREEGTDFWPKNRFFFYRFKLFFSPFSTQKPIPNVKIFIQLFNVINFNIYH